MLRQIKWTKGYSTQSNDVIENLWLSSNVIVKFGTCVYSLVDICERQIIGSLPAHAFRLP